MTQAIQNINNWIRWFIL